MILPFELDPQIIHHIIHNQAGSIGKAIIELIMNSVDAEAKTIRLTMNKEGFVCEDDGKGFVTEEDVINYFGRFGTPHQEGDATYGRFRLGRGQIMAHASTIWISNGHQMIVDTKLMGYNYDLNRLDEQKPGCHITGTWYENLSDTELLSTLQEIRDLVRYTPAAVELNGRMITRDPKSEKWDYEDENAYYRAKLEGAVSIYNQGVLVRHDASHLWGAGGLIVSKKAISLNVSRTEILRKTCPVWKGIAKQFQSLASEISERLNDNRKTEARREKSARSLLSGEGDLYRIVNREEVITILPGNRHVTLDYFFRRLKYEYKMKCCIVKNDFNIPKAETMARAKLAMFIHPRTLDRFGVYSPEQFLESLGLISDTFDQYCEQNGYSYRAGFMSTKPELLDYELISDAFVERMEILKEKDALDRETRRAWTALRWCLQQYAGACLGKRRYTTGRVVYGEEIFSILLGHSNTAEAWTDGETYIAFNVDVVKRLKGDPIKTAAYIFSLLEHEIAHEGDSVDVGHDELFYQRYHDISVRMSSERQRYMHMWLMKYTMSLEYEGKKSSGLAWSERVLIDRVGNGRQKRGLSRAIEDVSTDPVVQAHVPEENISLIAEINAGLFRRGLCPDAPKWEEILDRSRYTGRRESDSASSMDFDPDEEAYFDMMHEMYVMELAQERERICSIIGIHDTVLTPELMHYLEERSEEEILQLWAAKPWLMENDDSSEEEVEEDQNPLLFIDEKYHRFIETGETLWSIERNAAAAGFHNVQDYLVWRAGQ
jgi:hypothetical protein